MVGGFGLLDVRLLSLSVTGLQIEHSAPVKPGSSARAEFQVGGSRVLFSAEVVWSHLSKKIGVNGKLLYRSGLRSNDASALQTLIDALTTVGLLSADRDSMERKREKLEARQRAQAEARRVKLLNPQNYFATDQLLQIEQARDRLRLHPEEAKKWYNRAKYTRVEYAGQHHDTSFRDEVFAIWEYLERSVDLATIARVLDRRG